MSHKSRAAVLALSTIALTAAQPAWKSKPFSEWTEDDAKQVMSDSPWAKAVTPTLVKPPDQDDKQAHSGGRHRRGGSGTGDPGQPRNPQADKAPDKANASPTPSAVPLPKLTVRWESAAPQREAELKAHDPRAPAIDEDHYAVAVYGISRSMLPDDPKDRAEVLKKRAFLRPEGKRDIQPSRVEVLFREDGPIVLYLFPKPYEITWPDHHIEFDAQLGRLKVMQSFFVDDMMFHGKLEL